MEAPDSDTACPAADSGIGSRAALTVLFLRGL